MKKPTFSAALSALAICLAVATTAHAQDTTVPTNDFSVGTEQEVEVGQLQLVATHGDWAVQCVKVESGVAPCQIAQQVKDAEGFPIAEVILFQLPEGSPAVMGGSIVTPLGTLLTAQLSFGIDGAAAKNYPFNWCENVGCVSRVGFTAEELTALQAGQQAVMTIRSINNNQPITLFLSLKGFTAAYNASLPK